jgi:hypothetical protein
MSKHSNILRAALAAAAIAAALPALADTRLEVTTVKHPYVYYRDRDIYYAPESKTWYWLAEGNQWRSGPVLPTESQPFVRSGGVTIELDTERPYERNDEVVSRYKTTPGGAQVTERTETKRAPDGEVTTRREVSKVNPDESTERTVTTTTTKHKYVYYGARDIYFAPETRTWYWMADGNWRSGTDLPVELRASATTGGREIVLDTERPYERHSYVIAHYKHHDDAEHHRHHGDDEEHHRDDRDDDHDDD